MINILNNKKTKKTPTNKGTITKLTEKVIYDIIEDNLQDTTIEDFIDREIDESKMYFIKQRHIIEEIKSKEKLDMVVELSTPTKRERYKKELSKYIIGGIKSFYTKSNVDSTISMDWNTGRFNLEQLITNLMFKDVVTSEKESINVKTFIRREKRRLGFLRSKRVDINLKVDEYLEDSFTDYMTNVLKTNKDDINNTNIKLLIESPVGSGKSYMLGMFSNVVILKDNLGLVRNSHTDITNYLRERGIDKKVYMETGDVKHKGKFDEGSIIISTYNQGLKLHNKLGKEWMFILDEEHKLLTDLNFRKGVIVDVLHVLTNRDNYISISATNKDYSPLKYSNTLKVIKDMDVNKTKNLVLIGEKQSLIGKLYGMIEDKGYISNVKETTTLFYIVQDTVMVEMIVMDLKNKYPNLTIGEVTSDLINSRIDDRKEEGEKMMLDISTGDFKSYDVVISTPLLREGISLTTNRDNVYFFIEDNPDSLTIIQQHDRVRKGKNVTVVIKDKTSRGKNKVGKFKWDYYSSDTYLNRNEFTTIEDEDDEDDMVVEYVMSDDEKDVLYLMERYKKEKVERNHKYMLGYNTRHLDSGLSKMKSVLILNNINVVEHFNKIEYLNIDLELCNNDYNRDRRLEDVEQELVLEKLSKEYNFNIIKDLDTIYTRDGNLSSDNQKIVKQNRLEKSIDLVFNVIPENNKKFLPRVIKLDKTSQNVLYRKSLLEKITNYTEEEIKNIIRDGKKDIVETIVMNWIIGRRDLPSHTEEERITEKVIKSTYLRSTNSLVGVELPSLLTLGKTYTSKEVSDILLHCGRGERGKGYTIQRPLSLLKKVYNLEEGREGTGGRGSSYKLKGYKIDDSDFSSKIKKEYLECSIDDVFKVLSTTEEGEELINPVVRFPMSNK